MKQHTGPGINSKNYPKNYVISIPRSKTVLKQLNILEGNLVPPFDPHQKHYELSLRYGQDALTINALSKHNIKLFIQSQDGIQQINNKNNSIPIGESTLFLDVTNIHNITNRYTILITRASPPALSSFISSSGLLSPPFNPQIKSYKLNLDYNTTEVNFTMRNDDSDTLGRIFVDNRSTTYYNGDYLTTVYPEIGEDVIKIDILPFDGGDTVTYMVTTIRTQPILNLRDLTLSSGILLPNFHPDITTYSSNVTNSVDTIQLAPFLGLNAPKESTKINLHYSGTSQQVQDGESSTVISLNEGNNVFRIELTADGINSVSYNVTVFREGALELNTLDISGVQLNQTFSSNNFDYDITLPNANDSFIITPNLVDSTAGSIEVKVDGSGVQVDTNGSYLINQLGIGVTNITITVTAAQDQSITIYNIVVTRQDVLGLKSLDMSGVQLDTTFAANKYNYTTTVSNTQSDIILTPVVKDYTPSANMIVKVGSSVIQQDTNGQYTVPLVPGLNEIELKLEPTQGGNAVIYKITAIRENNLQLKSLDMSGVQLDTTFAANNYTYTSTVSNTQSDIILTPVVKDYTPSANMIVKVGSSVIQQDTNGQYTVPLVPGLNEIELKLEPTQGGNAVVYDITVIREGKLELKTLDISGVQFNQSFSSNLFLYNATVPNGQTSISLALQTQDHAPNNQIIVKNGNINSVGNNPYVIPISVGLNSIEVRIKPAQGGNDTVYMINLIREDVLELKTLNTSVGQLNTNLQSGNYNYTIALTNAQESIALTLVVNDYAPQWITPLKVDYNNNTIFPDSSGSFIISTLPVGTSTVKVTLNGVNAGLSTEYTIDITREAPPEAAKLAKIEVLGSLVDTREAQTAGINNMTTLKDFNPPSHDGSVMTYAYPAPASNNISPKWRTAYIVATPTEANSVVEIEPAIEGFTKHNSTSNSNTWEIYLDEPSVYYPFKLKVTAAATTNTPNPPTRTYNMVVTYTGTKLIDKLELTSSTASHIVWNPEFNSGVFIYDVNIGSNISGELAWIVDNPGSDSITDKHHQIEMFQVTESIFNNWSYTNIYNPGFSLDSTPATILSRGESNTFTDLNLSNEWKNENGVMRQYLVFASKSSSPRYYFVRLTKTSDGPTALLSSLIVKEEGTTGIALSPVFNPNITNYSIVTSASKVSVTVQLQSTAPTSAIAVNSRVRGQSTTNTIIVTPVSPTAEITMTQGEITDIDVVVTPQTGEPTVAYSIACNPAVVATLNSLATSSGVLTPSFTADQYKYTITLTNTQQSTSITTGQDAGATVTVTKGGVVQNVLPVHRYEFNNLPEGITQVAIEVTAQSKIKGVYEIDIVREKESLLSSIVLRQPIWSGAATGGLPTDPTCIADPISCTFPRFTSPLFVSSTKEYVALPGLIDSTVGEGRIWVRPTLASDSPASTIKITSQIRGESLIDITPSNTASYGIVVVKSNLITDVIFTITPVSGGPPTEYTVYIGERAQLPPVMHSISTDVGSLSPTFSSGTKSYNLIVPPSTSSITFTPSITSDTVGKVSVNNTITNSGVPTTVNISSGSTSVNVVAKSLHDSGLDTTYNINVVPLADDQLTNLTLVSHSNATFTPAFTPNIYSYDVHINSTFSSTTWSAVSGLGTQIQYLWADINHTPLGFGAQKKNSGEQANFSYFATAFNPTRQYIIIRVLKADGITPAGQDYKLILYPSS